MKNAVLGSTMLLALLAPAACSSASEAEADDDDFHFLGTYTPASTTPVE